jgi:hypothetical protein
MVYDSNGVITEYDSVTITNVGLSYYVTLNEPTPIIGSGVVSYLVNETDANTTYSLYTTPRTALIDNRILLAAEPSGMLTSTMMVYDSNGIITEYDGVTIVKIGLEFFAQLNESYNVTGDGVISFLVRQL